MPKWGLTEEQRDAEPWGLDADYLAPAKVITDPIHGDIFVTKLEQIFIDTEPVQRLRRIKQLGNTHLVYPGATKPRETLRPIAALLNSSDRALLEDRGIGAIRRAQPGRR
jgi:hypothetical protein